MTAPATRRPNERRKPRRAELRVLRRTEHYLAQSERAQGRTPGARVQAEVDHLRAVLVGMDPEQADMTADQVVRALRSVTTVLSTQAPRRSR